MELMNFQRRGGTQRIRFILASAVFQVTCSIVTEPHKPSAGKSKAASPYIRSHLTCSLTRSFNC